MGDEYPPLTSFSDQKRSEAMEKYEIIKPHILEQTPLLTIFEKTDVPIRTLQLWVRKYTKHGLKGLIRKSRSDANTVKMDTAVQETIKGLILKLHFFHSSKDV